jgi:RimJ/RimL family protein N-acetyltransferase
MVAAVLTAEPFVDMFPPASPIPKFIPTLTDGTIVLGALRPADATTLSSMADEAIRRTLGSVDPTSPMTVEAATWLIDRWAIDPDEHAFALRRDGALVGIATARAEVGGWVAVLAVCVAPAARHARIGTRALRLLADFVVEIHKASRLRIDTLDGDRPAHRLAESLGFKRLEHFPSGAPGWAHHGLTHEEWEELSLELASTLGQGSIAD